MIKDKNQDISKLKVNLDHVLKMVMNSAVEGYKAKQEWFIINCIMIDEGRIIKGREGDEDEKKDEKYIKRVLERAFGVMDWKTRKMKH